jgi:hypothetical protein
MRFYHKDFIVSTVHIFDRWETCIFDDEASDSEVVDYAFSDKDADKMHAKWVDAVKKDSFSLDSLRDE